LTTTEQLTIPVAAAQRMFFDTGLSRNEAAKRLGWKRFQWRARRWQRKDGSWGEATYNVIIGDVTRLGRTLGLNPCWDKNGEAYWQETLHYETAVTLCRAWGLDPVDYGI